MDSIIKVGRVYNWLNQGPAVILEECEVEAEAIEVGELIIEAPETEKGWVISLLETGEILTVHSDTLHTGVEA